MSNASAEQSHTAARKNPALRKERDSQPDLREQAHPEVASSKSLPKQPSQKSKPGQTASQPASSPPERPPSQSRPPRASQSQVKCVCKPSVPSSSYTHQVSIKVRCRRQLHDSANYTTPRRWTDARCITGNPPEMTAANWGEDDLV